jgi:hypothetical protein
MKINKMQFFTTHETKQRLFPTTTKEFKQYAEICKSIWGAIPYNVTWAIGTNIYKNYKKEHG